MNNKRKTPGWWMGTTKLEDWEAEKMQNPAFRAAVEASEPEYQKGRAEMYRRQKMGKRKRERKARLALYRFLHEAMWEGEDCPAPPIVMPFMGKDYDEYITEELHDLLGIKRSWWKRHLG